MSPRSPLWPNDADGERSRLGTAFSHYWSKYRRAAGVDQPRKTFHSFRHTFLDKLANLEPRPEIVSDISGHTIKSQVFGRYRKRAPAGRLLRSIGRVRYKVSFRHLIESDTRD
jgi:integrase